jgi:uncharacterized phage-associated protein
MAATETEPNVVFDKEKFLSVVHWVCHFFKGREEQLGRTKLHKILYFADMLCFVDSGRPLTGVDYIKQPYGPTARYLGWALRALVDAKLIEISRHDYFGLQKFDFVSKAEPRTNMIADREATLLAEVCDFVAGRSAKEITEISHAEPWAWVKFGERIPYGSAYRLAPDRRTPSGEDVAWGHNAAAEIGEAAFNASAPR